MSAKVTPIRNPFYQGESDVMSDVRMSFHSKIFHLDKNDTSGDHVAYRALMNEILDNSSRYYMFKEPSKSWTKEGRLLIHVEYYEAIREEKSVDEIEY